MSNIVLSDVAIKNKSGGMYCLNDLHKASGGSRKHSPSEWLRNDSTKALADEILNTGKTAIKKSPGRYGGTYVSKELVYSYAMWISPAFNLQVIQEFDNLKKITPTLNELGVSIKEKCQSLSDQISAASVELDELKSHGNSWGTYGAAIRTAKKDAVLQLEQLKDEIQMKLDFM